MNMFVTILPYVLSLFDNMMVFTLNFILLDINKLLWLSLVCTYQIYRVFSVSFRSLSFCFKCIPCSLGINTEGFCLDVYCLYV